MSRFYELKKDDFLVRLNGYQIIHKITTNVKLSRPDLEHDTINKYNGNLYSTCND